MYKRRPSIIYFLLEVSPSFFPFTSRNFLTIKPHLPLQLLDWKEKRATPKR